MKLLNFVIIAVLAIGAASLSINNVYGHDEDIEININIETEIEINEDIEIFEDDQLCGDLCFSDDSENSQIDDLSIIYANNQHEAPKEINTDVINPTLIVPEPKEKGIYFNSIKGKVSQ